MLLAAALTLPPGRDAHGPSFTPRTRLLVHSPGLLRHRVSRDFLPPEIRALGRPGGVVLRGVRLDLPADPPVRRVEAPGAQKSPRPVPQVASVEDEQPDA